MDHSGACTYRRALISDRYLLGNRAGKQTRWGRKGKERIDRRVTQRIRDVIPFVAPSGTVVMPALPLPHRDRTHSRASAALARSL